MKYIILYWSLCTMTITQNDNVEIKKHIIKDKFERKSVDYQYIENIKSDTIIKYFPKLRKFDNKDSALKFYNELIEESNKLILPTSGGHSIFNPKNRSDNYRDIIRRIRIDTSNLKLK